MRALLHAKLKKIRCKVFPVLPYYFTKFVYLGIMKGESVKNNLKRQVYVNWHMPLREHKTPLTPIISHFLSERKGDLYV